MQSALLVNSATTSAAAAICPPRRASPNPNLQMQQIQRTTRIANVLVSKPFSSSTQLYNSVAQGAPGRSLPRLGIATRSIGPSKLGRLGNRHPSSSAPLQSSRRRAEAAAAEMATTEVMESAPAWQSFSEKLRGAKFGLTERVAHAKDRVFSIDQQTKVVFYRDNSSWCPYCERVWLQLEEKKINYTVEKINMRCYGEKPAWYTRMVPSGLLPAVMLDGELLTESLDIMFILEEKFPNNTPLLPKQGTPEFAALDGLLKLERKLFGAWLGRLTRSWGDSGFETTMDSANAALKKLNGPYFLGSQFSLVDALYAPFLERIAASVPYWPGIQVRGAARWPNINSWYDAMDSRPSYLAIKSDDFGITHNLEPQIGPCKSAQAGASYRALVDGKDGSWALPLKPEATAWGFDDGTGSSGAKEEAAQSLTENHTAIVGFALRGVRDGEKYRAAVDLGFRHVAGALLFGTHTQQIPEDLPKEVAIAAAYLRDRVGVPRDLTYPAARQLRAHLQWLVKQSGYSF